MLDLLIWMLGDVDEVTADIGPVTGRFGAVDESGRGLIHFKSGVTGVVAGSWVDRENPLTLRITGTEGHAAIIKGQLYFRSSKVAGADALKPWRKLPRGQQPPLNMWLDAVSGVTGLPLVPADDAAARVGVMEAMYQASVRRTWVKPT